MSEGENMPVVARLGAPVGKSAKTARSDCYGRPCSRHFPVAAGASSTGLTDEPVMGRAPCEAAAGCRSCGADPEWKQRSQQQQLWYRQRNTQLSETQEQQQ